MHHIGLNCMVHNVGDIARFYIGEFIMTYIIENLKTASKKELGATERLCRVIAKSGKVENRVIESQGVILNKLSVNSISVIANNEAGAEFLLNAVYGVQDGIVRKLVAAGKMSVFDEQIGIDAILAAMAESNEVSRFSTKSIAAWFESDMKPVLSAALQAKGFNGAAMDKMLSNYLASFQVLAGRNPSMDTTIKAGLIRALELLPEGYESVTCNTIAEKLATVQQASAILAAL